MLKKTTLLLALLTMAFFAADTAVVMDRNGESDGARLLDGNASAQSLVNVSGLPATVTVTFDEPRTISTVRLLSGVAEYLNYPSGDISLTSCVIEGNSTASGTWRELVNASTGAPVAKNADEADETRAWQFDFTAIEVRGIRVTLKDSNDTMKRGSGPIDRKEVLLREIEAYDKNAGAAMGLANVLQAEFRVQAYRYQDTAEIHAILAEEPPPFEVEVSVKERWNGAVPCNPFRFTLKPGLNIIPINIKGWENGEYRTQLRTVDKNAPARGEIARLLRVDRIEAAVPPARFADMDGKRLYFPDAWYLESHKGLEFKMFKPDVHYLDFPRISSPKAYIKLGSTLYWLKDGRLVMTFNEYDYEWKHTGVNYAACTPGKWDWKLVDQPKDDEIEMENGAEMLRTQGTVLYEAGGLPGASVGNEGKFRMYDPEKDGPVDLREVRVQYVGYKPLDWGCVKPEAQSTWVLWKKGDEFIVLQDKPLLLDNASDIGGFEAPTDSNDNHAGQWLSADGRTLYFVRGHMLRRYPPFIDRYDNLWPVSRILTVFSTQDGLNWKRHYYSLPDESDPPNMQHYGSDLFHAPKGNDLMVGFMMPYNAHTQQYNIELTWSWNGEEWHRFDGHPRWIDNGGPDEPAFGIINMHGHIVEKDGVIYHEIGWATPAPHFSGDSLYTPGRGGQLTGEEVRKLNEKRGVSTSWPYWSHYGSWEKLAEAWNTVTSTCGVAVYRKGGLFGAVAGKSGAFFTTRPMAAKGKLTANIKVNDGGFAKFTILDKDGNILAAKKLQGDGIALPLFDSLPDGDFRIHAELKDAILYTLNFE